LIFRQKFIPFVLIFLLFNSSFLSQAFAEQRIVCSGGGWYRLSDGVVLKYIDPVGKVQCSGEVVLDSSAIQIGPSSFSGLNKITKVTLPEGLTSISSSAFTGASSLTTFSIPSSVGSIGTEVFSGTDSLQSFVVAVGNQNFSSLNGTLFNKSQTLLIAYPAANTRTSFIIPSTVTTISSTAFLGAKNLTSVTIPSSVTSIGSKAFSGASNLTSIVFPASVTSIGSDVLGDTTSLTGITVENGNQNYTTLEGALFDKNKTLLLGFPVKSSQTNFALPDSVVRIEASMFKNAKNLTSITLGKSLEFIGNSAFEGASSLIRISIPRAVTSIGSQVFYSTPALTTIEVDTNNQFYFSIGGILFDKEKENLLSYPSASPAKSFSIPSTVTEIEEVAFSSVKNLESISLEPGNATFLIENGALLDKEKTKIIFYSRNNTNSTYTVPSTVSEIYRGAFSNAKNLSAFKVESNNANFTTIDGVLFEEDGEILVAYPSANLSPVYIIPSKVTNIKADAFVFSQLITLVINDEADRSKLTDSGISSTIRVITSSQYADEAKALVELKAKQEAEAKAAVELKIKQEAEVKAAAELKIKQEAEAAAVKAAASKKTTINCIKGKTIKKVTAVKPKCPAGFKKK
jgi:hypothetical protein